MNSSLDAICEQIALGRELARRLNGWLRGQCVNEAEFRLLWLLSRRAAVGLEQRKLAERLGVSPAQVSACVDRLRQRKWIAPVSDQADRRRHCWQLTPSGRQHFSDVCESIETQLRILNMHAGDDDRWRPSREDAA